MISGLVLKLLNDARFVFSTSYESALPASGDFGLAELCTLLAQVEPNHAPEATDAGRGMTKERTSCAVSPQEYRAQSTEIAQIYSRKP